MAKFTPKPPTIDAMQFAGDVASADQINFWLSSYGWYVLRDPSQNQLIVRKGAGASLVMLIAESTDWVLMDAMFVVSVMSNDEFDRSYQSVPE